MSLVAEKQVLRYAQDDSIFLELPVHTASLLDKKHPADKNYSGNSKAHAQKPVGALPGKQRDRGNNQPNLEQSFA
jgi:hypothetical protein